MVQTALPIAILAIVGSSNEALLQQSMSKGPTETRGRKQYSGMITELRQDSNMQETYQRRELHQALLDNGSHPSSRLAPHKIISHRNLGNLDDENQILRKSFQTMLRSDYDPYKTTPSKISGILEDLKVLEYEYDTEIDQVTEDNCRLIKKNKALRTTVKEQSAELKNLEAQCEDLHRILKDMRKAETRSKNDYKREAGEQQTQTPKNVYPRLTDTHVYSEEAIQAEKNLLVQAKSTRSKFKGIATSQILSRQISIENGVESRLARERQIRELIVKQDDATARLVEQEKLFRGSQERLRQNADAGKKVAAEYTATIQKMHSNDVCIPIQDINDSTAAFLVLAVFTGFTMMYHDDVVSQVQQQAIAFSLWSSFALEQVRQHAVTYTSSLHDQADVFLNRLFFVLSRQSSPYQATALDPMRQVVSRDCVNDWMSKASSLRWDAEESMKRAAQEMHDWSQDVSNGVTGIYHMLSNLKEEAVLSLKQQDLHIQKSVPNLKTSAAHIKLPPAPTVKELQESIFSETPLSRRLHEIPSTAQTVIANVLSFSSTYADHARANFLETKGRMIDIEASFKAGSFDTSMWMSPKTESLRISVQNQFDTMKGWGSHSGQHSSVSASQVTSTHVQQEWYQKISDHFEGLKRWVGHGVDKIADSLEHASQQNLPHKVSGSRASSLTIPKGVQNDFFPKERPQVTFDDFTDLL